MLPTYARMRRSEDFRRTVRLGVRAGRRTLVVHALQTPPASQVDGLRSLGRVSSTPTVGFVVSKAVGSAVRRNRVRRRLRHLALPRLGDLGEGTTIVVRALPPAAAAGPELSNDLDAAWSSALAKLRRR